MSVGVLMTRPESEAIRSARILQHEGFYPIIHPVLQIQSFPEAVEALISIPANAILITSPQAAQCWLAKRDAPQLPMFVVGEKTAATIRNSLPHTELTHAPEAASLLPLIRARFPKASQFLYPRGRDVSFPLGEELARDGHTVREAIVYKAERGESFSESLIHEFRSGDIQVVMHYSIRSARLFEELAREAGVFAALRNLTAIAISPKVADAMKEQPWGRIAAAETPDEDAMLETLRRLYPAASQTTR